MEKEEKLNFIVNSNRSVSLRRAATALDILAGISIVALILCLILPAPDSEYNSILHSYVDVTVFYKTVPFYIGGVIEVVLLFVFSAVLRGLSRIVLAADCYIAKLNQEQKIELRHTADLIGEDDQE